MKKCIFSPQLANFLLGYGYKIVRLLPNDNDPDSIVFVFEVDEHLNDALTEWKQG